MCVDGVHEILTVVIRVSQNCVLVCINVYVYWLEEETKKIQGQLDTWVYTLTLFNWIGERRVDQWRNSHFTVLCKDKGQGRICLTKGQEGTLYSDPEGQKESTRCSLCARSVVGPFKRLFLLLNECEMTHHSFSFCLFLNFFLLVISTFVDFCFYSNSHLVPKSLSGILWVKNWSNIST